MKRMRRGARRVLAAALLVMLSNAASSRDSGAVTAPAAFVYATPDTFELKAYVFKPAESEGAARHPGIVIFHGGGWNLGSPEWAFGRARHFAGLGMVAVAVQYRLSDQGSITPLEAMADARAVIRWLRSETSLDIAKDKIAAYGWSAGAQLAASAAMIPDPGDENPVSCVPDALILISPAVSLGADPWPQKLLGDRADVEEISPDNYVRPGLPPAILLQGRTDTVTPLAGVEKFHDLMLKAGNRCDLHIYDGVGHLFTPAGEPDDGYPNPDPEVQASAYREADEFLRSLGIID